MQNKPVEVAGDLGQERSHVGGAERNAGGDRRSRRPAFFISFNVGVSGWTGPRLGRTAMCHFLPILTEFGRERHRLRWRRHREPGSCSGNAWSSVSMGGTHRMIMLMTLFSSNTGPYSQGRCWRGRNPFLKESSTTASPSCGGRRRVWNSSLHNHDLDRPAGFGARPPFCCDPFPSANRPARSCRRRRFGGAFRFPGACRLSEGSPRAPARFRPRRGAPARAG